MTTISSTPRPIYVYDAANDEWVPVGAPSADTGSSAQLETRITMLELGIQILN